jgi:hypothetical protein
VKGRRKRGSVYGYTKRRGGKRENGRPTKEGRKEGRKKWQVKKER